MSLLSVVKDVCAVVGVLRPSSVFSGIDSNRTMQEMVALANEMAQRIAYDQRDWTRLRKTWTMTGDGVATAFNLPANYKRMLLTANVWRSTSTVQPMTFIPDTDEWINRRAWGYNNAWGEWTMLGGQMHIWPPMAGYVPAVPADPLAVPPVVFKPEVPAVTANFSYMDKNCVALNSSGYGDVFVDDADTFLLDERLLKLGMIWQWKSQKGAPYAEDMGNYETALANVAGRDSPAPIIIGRKSMSANVRVAYPYPLPTP